MAVFVWRQDRFSRALALLLLVLPLPASGLPMLQLFLDGDVDTLGAGGEFFRNPEAEALRLERPTLLANRERAFFSFGFENEAIVSVDAGSWRGSEIYDRRLRLVAGIPLREQLGGLPLLLWAGVSREMGMLHLAKKGKGTLLHAEESRDRLEAGVSLALPHGFSLGGGVKRGDANTAGYTLEARYRQSELAEAWVRRREEAVSYAVTIPDGLATKMASPRLDYRIHDFEAETEVGARFGDQRFAWAQLGVELEGPNDHWAEVGGRALPWLALRLGIEQEWYRFDDPMDATGTGQIARVDLGLLHRRYFGGADLDLSSRDRLRLRYARTQLSADSLAEEIGANATRAFLQVDYAMGLLFEGAWEADAHQLSAGWDRDGNWLDFSLGAQFLRLGISPADYQVHATALQRSLASETLEAGTLTALGVTGAIHVPLGRFRISAAMGQLIPVAFEGPADRGGGGGPPGGGGGGGGGGPKRKPPRAGPWEWLTKPVGEVLQALDDYGGGNRLLVQIGTEF